MKKTIAIIFVLLISSHVVFAGGDGGYAGAFLRMGIGARAKALGDAYTALPSGSVVSLYNPAALTKLTNREATLSSSILPLDRRLDYVGFAMSLHPKVDEDEQGAGRALDAGFALGWVHAGVNNIDGRDANGKHIGNFSNSENAFYFSFALSPHKMISVGLNAKVLYNRFPMLKDDNKALSATGFGMDIGLLAAPINGLTLGLAVRDYSSKYSWNSEGLWDRATSTVDKFPRIFRAGAAYQVPGDWLLLVFDAEDSYDQDPRYHFGAEFKLNQVGALRLGWDHDALTAGFGVVVPKTKDRLVLNYAFWSEPSGAGTAHIFDLAISLPKGRQ